jgi:hypothetical protein
MKKFILILFKEFSRKDECKDIVTVLAPIVDSKFLKFHHTKGSMIIHFESEVGQDELTPFIQGVLYGIVSTFILSEYTDRMSLVMPQDILEHLLDLENDSEGTIKFKPNSDGEYVDDDYMDNDFISLILDDIKWKIKKPSLDQILEKIKKNGIKSLSEFEKEILEEYSKN